MLTMRVSKANYRRSVSGGLVMYGGMMCVLVLAGAEIRSAVYDGGRVSCYGRHIQGSMVLRQIWRFTLPEVGMPHIPVFEDNQGHLQLAQNPITNSNSKHIDVRHHFIRDLVARQEISVNHVAD